MMKDKNIKNTPNFKEIKHLKRQATTEKCAYNKHNVTVTVLTLGWYVLV